MKATPAYPRGKGYAVKTGLSAWSQVVSGQLPTRPSGPTGVTVTASPALESIILSWTAPTLRADGTLLKVGELHGFWVYWSTSPGIDINNPTTFDGRFSETAERYTFTLPDPGTTLGPYFFVVTAYNTQGMESVPSAEVSASGHGQTAATPIVDDWATGNAEAILVGKERIFVRFRLPKTTWVGFSFYNLYFDVDTGAGFSGVWTSLAAERIGFMHSNLNQAHKYRYKITIVAEDGTETTGSIHDNAGLGFQPNATDQSAILADTIAAQHIIAQYDMIAQRFIGGTLQSTNWGTAAGTEIDLDAERLRFGGSTNPALSWDGTTLAVRGAITIVSGSGVGNLTDAGALATRNNVDLATGDVLNKSAAHIAETAARKWAGQTGADVTKTIIDGGLITTGTIQLSDGAVIRAGMTAVGAGDANVRLWAGNTFANRGIAPFRVTQGGAMFASNATITGALTAGIGSSIAGAYIHDVNADTITAGIITGRLFRTGVTGNRLMVGPVIGTDVHSLCLYDSAGVRKITIQSPQIIIDGWLRGFSGAKPVRLAHCVGRVTFSGATIFNGTSPTTWTILDISGSVPDTSGYWALCLLRIRNTSGNDVNCRFREFGVTAQQHTWVNNFPGALSTRVDTIEEFNWVWAVADDLGRIEWDTDLARHLVVNLVAWIK